LILLARWDRACLLAHLGLQEQAVELLESLERELAGVIANLPPGRAREATLRMYPSTWAVLGEIYDDPFAPSLNNPTQALIYKEKVCSGWQQHLEHDQNDNYALRGLGDCMEGKASSRLRLDPGEAVAEARLGFDLLRRANTTDSGNAARRGFSCASCALTLATALLADGQAAQARPVLEEAEQGFRREVASKKDNPEVLSALVFTLVVRARAETALGDHSAARHTATEAAQLGGALASSLDLHVRRAAAAAYDVSAEVAGDAERCGWRQKELSVWESWTANASPWVARQKQDSAVKLADCAGSRTAADPKR
jgi:hypothetical protein